MLLHMYRPPLSEPEYFMKQHPIQHLQLMSFLTLFTTAHFRNLCAPTTLHRRNCSKWNELGI